MGEKDKKVCIPLFEISNSWYAKIFNIQTASDSVLNMKSRLVKLHIFKIYKKLTLEELPYIRVYQQKKKNSTSLIP